MSYVKQRSQGQKRSRECSDILIVVHPTPLPRALLRPSTLGVASSFSLRELLRCEAALARLYCRMALLNIFAPKLPHLFTRLFHIPAIRDITLEHLQLLSNQLLAPPLPGKTCLEEKSAKVECSCELHPSILPRSVRVSQRPVVAMLTALVRSLTRLM